MPYVFVGTKDYATGLMDATSMGFGVAGSATSLDVSSWYATKQMVIGSAYLTTADISGLASSADIASHAYVASSDVASFGFSTKVSAMAVNFIGF